MLFIHSLHIPKLTSHHQIPPEANFLLKLINLSLEINTKMTTLPTLCNTEELEGIVEPVFKAGITFSTTSTMLGIEHWIECIVHRDSILDNP